MRIPFHSVVPSVPSRSDLAVGTQVKVQDGYHKGRVGVIIELKRKMATMRDSYDGATP